MNKMLLAIILTFLIILISTISFRNGYEIGKREIIENSYDLGRISCLDDESLISIEDCKDGLYESSKQD